MRPASEALLAARRVRVGGQVHNVRRARPAGGAVVMEVGGVTSRDAAEALRGVKVELPRDALPPLARDQRYVADLEGFAAVAATGERLGEVAGVVNYGAGDILVLRNPERLVPLLAGVLVEVRDDARVVVLALPEGLP